MFLDDSCQGAQSLIGFSRTRERCSYIGFQHNYSTSRGVARRILLLGEARLKSYSGRISWMPVRSAGLRLVRVFFIVSLLTTRSPTGTDDADSIPTVSVHHRQ